MQEVCRAVDANRDVRVVTIAGAGERAFSAGSDLNTLADLSDVMAFRDRVEYAALVRDIRKPVIAALKGWVLGGGMEIAIAADIRICGRGARIGGPEVTRGWLGGGGASQMLPRLVGIGQTMRLLLTGDPVDAETALRLGLVEEVVDDAEVTARVIGDGKEDRFVQPDRDPSHQGRGSCRDVDAVGGRDCATRTNSTSSACRTRGGWKASGHSRKNATRSFRDGPGSGRAGGNSTGRSSRF